MNEKDFLQGYEIKNWEFSPRIYKIIAAATVFNILGLLVLAQTNVMSASACQSPFVNRVCTVLDTVYVGSKLFGNPAEFGSDPNYELPDIKDDEVVWLPQDGVTPPLEYPEGYFQIANRDELAALEILSQDPGNDTFNPTLTPNPNGSTTVPPSFTPSTRRPPPSSRGGDSIAKKRPKFPNKIADPTKGEGDDNLYEVDNSDETTADKDNKKEPSADKNNSVTDKSAKNSDAVKDMINKKPLEDFVAKFVTEYEEKGVDVTKPFSLTLKTRLTKEGEYQEGTASFTKAAGDELMVESAKEALMALGASKFLSYLTVLDVKEIELTVVQDENEFYAIIVSDQKNASMAKTVASGLNTYISLAKVDKKLRIKGLEEGEKRKSEEDQLVLLENAKVSNDGKNFVMKIGLPKPLAQQMIKRNLDAEAKKQEGKDNTPQKKPNGNATNLYLKENLGR